MKPCACACAVCCGIVVLIVAVMVPVGIFVIAPKVAQSMIDDTVVTLNNSTLVPKELTIGGWGELYTNVTMDTPGPFGVTLNSYKTTLSSNGYDFGYFDFPKESVKVGNMTVTFDANFTITNVSVLTNWTLTWLLLDPTAIINLDIHGTVSASTLGLTLHPKQYVSLWCSQLPGGPEDGISMKCTPDYPKKPEELTVVVDEIHALLGSDESKLATVPSLSEQELADITEEIKTLLGTDESQSAAAPGLSTLVV